MQHLFGCFLLEKHFAKGSCAKHKGAMRIKEGNVSGTEPQQRLICDMCGEIMDEEDVSREAEYVPATYMHGKYVLLYLTDPTGNNIAAYKPAMEPAATPFSMGYGHNALSTPSLSSSIHVTDSTVRLPLTTGVPALAYNTQFISSATTVTSKSSRRVKSLISAFYHLLIRQLTVSSSQDGKPVFPVVVLEVRQPIGLDDAPPSNTVLGEQRAVSAIATTADAARDVPSSSSPQKTEGIRSVLDFSPTEPRPSLNIAITSSPFFGGWFSLEAPNAYRQVIETFGVSTWPSVLLFDPNGQLLTIHALNYIEREVSYGTMDSSQPFSPAGHEAEHQDRYAGFHSDFPWLMEETPEVTDKESESSIDVFPFSSLLRRLIPHTRRVGRALDCDFPAEPECMAERDEYVKPDECLDGATHLALYFSGGWHPSSNKILPRLRSLWSALNGGVEDVDSGRDHHKEECFWNMEREALNVSLSGAGLTSVPQCILSYRTGAYGGRHYSNSQMDSDTRGFSSNNSPLETPVRMSKEKVFRDASPHVNLGTEPKPEGTSAKQLSGVPSRSLSPAHSSSQRQPSSPSPQERLEEKVELDREEEEEEEEKQQQQQQRRAVHLQVVYLSCDADKSQLYSVLGDMPSSWLCVSSLFGPNHRKMLEECLDIFDVRVFPRLVFTEVRSGSEMPGPASGSSLVTLLPNLNFHVLQSHGEGLIFCDNAVKEFPWREEKRGGLPQLPFRRPVAHEFSLLSGSRGAIKSFLAEGGCLFLLCGTGKVSAELHKMCAAAVNEASLWWSQEIGLFSERLKNRLTSSSRGTLAPTDCFASEQVPGNPHWSTTSDVWASVTPAATLVESSAAATNEQMPYLPVYFFDAVVEETAMGNDLEAESQNGSDGGEGHTSSACKEEKALLQEYVLSEVLEDAHLLPPVEGEPFLLCVQWPGRRAAVLRQKFEYENGSGPASAISLRSSCSTGTNAPHSNSYVTSGNAMLLDARQVGMAASSGASTVPCQCPGYLSAAMRLEPSPGLYSSNPLCSVPHVKAFIAQHAVWRRR
ncbi:hypothetical protein C3747_13g279 [Trypanosoma cruzi]|uniref:Uncharacterized protein n=2 Tax=Trypanosoma cruzi TaxID=5693 RepID=A0A2V2XEK1_TRYCR|nr:hypothetical protein C3747_13g279 [Trypanosoma cruzi]